MKQMDRNTFTLSMFSPSRFFPSADEVPFPDGETALAVQTMLDSESEDARKKASKDSRVALLDAAEAEGLLAKDLTGDIPPWTGVLALEVERTRSNAVSGAQFEDLVDEMLERFGEGPFDGRPSLISRNREARTFYQTHRMPRDASIQLHLALEVIEQAGPDHPASDYARLYALEAVSDLTGTAYNAEEAVDLAFEILEDTPDPLVAEEALFRITRFPDADLSDEQFEFLERATKEFSPHKESIAILGLNASYDQGDYARAARWWAVLDDEVATSCSCRHPDPPPLDPWGPPPERDVCNYECTILERARVQLGVLGEFAPRDWQDALRVAVLGCHADGVSEQAKSLRADGVWSREWSWTSWDPPGAFAACVEQRATQGPPPSDGQRVLLLAGSARK